MNLAAAFTNLLLVSLWYSDQTMLPQYMSRQPEQSVMMQNKGMLQGRMANIYLLTKLVDLYAAGL